MKRKGQRERKGEKKVLRDIYYDFLLPLLRYNSDIALYKVKVLIRYTSMLQNNYHQYP